MKKLRWAGRKLNYLRRMFRSRDYMGACQPVNPLEWFEVTGLNVVLKPKGASRFSEKRHLLDCCRICFIELFGKQNRIDNMNYAIGLVDIGDRHSRHAALRIAEFKALAVHARRERVATHCLKTGSAPAGLN